MEHCLFNLTVIPVFVITRSIYLLVEMLPQNLYFFIDLPVACGERFSLHASLGNTDKELCNGWMLLSAFYTILQESHA